METIIFILILEHKIICDMKLLWILKLNKEISCECVNLGDHSVLLLYRNLAND